MLKDFLRPSLDKDFEDSLNRNGLRACVMFLAVLFLGENWTVILLCLLAVYEVFLAIVGGGRRYWRDSFYDWVGGASGAVSSMLWVRFDEWYWMAAAAFAILFTLGRALVASKKA